MNVPMLEFRRLQVALVLLGLLFLPVPSAALEKCVGADGKVSYSDHGCAAGAKRTSLGGASLDNVQMEYYDASAPGGHQGHTDWSLSYQYKSRTVPGGCRADPLETRLQLKVRLPRWRGASGASPDLASRWSRYLSALEVHEAGHVQTGRDFEASFRRAAASLTAPDCGSLDAALRAQFQSMLKQANARDADYDAQTRHGATQGAYYR